MRCSFTASLRFVAGVAIVLIAGVPVAVQSQTAAGKSSAGAKASPAPKTAWGHPDLQGIWTNTTTTPLERLPEAADKQVLTEEERTELARKVAERVNADTRRPGQVGAYNEFWFERGTLNTRTSLVIDPPEGKVPAYTPAAQKRWEAIDAARKAQPADSWLDRHTFDRCITRGMPGAMIPGFYNHNYHILQTPNYVAIVVEMLHDARIIPLDGRPHLNSGLTQWLGDSRGHWEGDTLVVETTNLTDKIFERSNVVTGFGSGWRLIERFRRVDADTIDYQFTVDDPRTFTKPWTVAAPMSKSDGRLFEYACHEGNYAMSGILSAARHEERQGSTQKK
jgi:hypothetical protein